MKVKCPQIATSEKQNMITVPYTDQSFLFQKLHNISNNINVHQFYTTILQKFLLIYRHIKVLCDLAQTKYAARHTHCSVSSTVASISLAINFRTVIHDKIFRLCWLWDTFYRNTIYNINSTNLMLYEELFQAEEYL